MVNSARRETYAQTYTVIQRERASGEADHRDQRAREPESQRAREPESQRARESARFAARQAGRSIWASLEPVASATCLGSPANTAGDERGMPGSRARCFCVSKARPPPPSLDNIEGYGDTLLATDNQPELRTELEALRVKELEQRALAEGVPADDVEDARDEDNPKAALIELIVWSVQSHLPEGRGADNSAEPFDPGLGAELEVLRATALQLRALAEGVAADAIEDALDEDNPKAALIGLIVASVQQRGPADRLLLCLSGGGDAAADAIDRVLEQGMHVFEQLLVTSPRRERKSAREALASLERASEMVDSAWCDGMCACGDDELSVLVGHLLGVEALSSCEGVSDVSVSDRVSMVSEMVRCLDRCGSRVVQSVCLLRRLCSSDSSSSVSCVGALEVLRGLSPERVRGEEVCDRDEVAAFELVMGRMSECGECVGDEVVSGCMSLFTLGCRIGLAVCGESDALIVLSSSLLVRWYEHLCGSREEDDLVSGSALGALYMLASSETVPKVPSDRRAALESACGKSFNQTLSSAGSSLTVQRVEEVCDALLQADMLGHEDVSLACGLCYCLGVALCQHPAALAHADSQGIFSRVLELYSRVIPVSLSAEWWAGACAEVNVTTARLSGVWFVASQIKRLEGATASSWWAQLLDAAIEMVKMNSVAGLSGLDTMCCSPVYFSASVVELAAGDESQHSLLLGSGVVEALEYGIMHDFSFAGVSLSAYAAGAAVALVGRREGGRTLGREAVLAVLERQQVFFTEGGAYAHVPVKSVLSSFHHVVTLSISDANKKHMIEFEPLVDMLLECLLLDESNHRHGQEGHDALQEASAGVIQELSLYGPGCALLRSHGEVLSSLHRLVEVGTKASKERGAGALFELDEEVREGARSSSSGDEGVGAGGLSAAVGGAPPPPHVMVSYNWDHQDVILRVVGSLQSRGYLVWVDIEQMKGSTVDTMASAVEGSAVVLIGVSRAYKESTNCRMECQYAFEKKKAIVPLKLTDGYEADGWLGLLLGTSLWYAFYGSTLSSESAFESHVDSLARELGDRGRRDAVTGGAYDDDDESCVDANGTETRQVQAEDGCLPEAELTEMEQEDVVDPALCSELALLRLNELKQRALADGVDTRIVGDALDADNPKAVLIELIAAAAPSGRDRIYRLVSAADAREPALLRAELEVLRLGALHKRAVAAGVDADVVGDALDQHDPKAALIELIVAAAAVARGCDVEKDAAVSEFWIAPRLVQ